MARNEQPEWWKKICTPQVKKWYENRVLREGVILHSSNITFSKDVKASQNRAKMWIVISNTFWVLGHLFRDTL